MNIKALRAVCIAAGLSVALPAQGIGLGQETAAPGIEEIVVRADQVRGSATAPGADAARGALARIPGAIGFVEQSEFADDFAQSIGDTLVFTPGVFADTSAQRENRISIRGSGLTSSFERRGISLYRDGVPVTRASGSTEFQEVDPTTISYLEVYKGANGLRYGAAALGGVINMVTPTGLTAEDRWRLRLEGGSFGTQRASLAFAESSGNADVYAALTRLQADGYRDHSAVDSYYGFANAGLQLGERLENRIYLTFIRDRFELAGSLSLEDALADVSLAGRPVTVGPFFPGGPLTVLDPGPQADDWDRNLEVVRIADHLVWDTDRARMQAGGWYSRRKLDHAITRFAGIIDQVEHEAGMFARASGAWDTALEQADWTVGVEFNRATNDARTYQNVSGAPGALSTRSDQDAWNLLGYAQLELPFSERLRAVTGVQVLRASRRNQALVNDVSGRVTVSQLNPRIGLLWRPAERVDMFVNLSRGFEPASMADLTAGGALDFTPLAPQKAWTLEIGSRGSRGPLAWDLALYRSHIRNELLDYGAPGLFGFVSFTDNADRSIHQGLELGVDLHIAREPLSQRGLTLLWRHIYTYNDFRFDGDPLYGDKQLAGVPEHLWVSELRLQSRRGWYGTLNFRWVPEGPYVDFQNTTETPDYLLVGLTAGVELSERLTLFTSVENLFDERYISNVGTNANQSLEQARLFTPGQGRAWFGGLTLRI